jgi:hypothetical protein
MPGFGSLLGNRRDVNTPAEDPSWDPQRIVCLLSACTGELGASSNARRRAHSDKSRTDGGSRSKTP